MKVRSLILLFVGLASEPFGSTPTRAQTPNFLTIQQAYCAAHPLAVAWNATAVPARLVGDNPDDHLRSRVWTVWFNPGTGQTPVLSVVVQDGIPSVASVFQGVFDSGPFPASFISGDQALAQLHSIPGYGTAQVTSTEAIYNPSRQNWIWGLHTPIAVVSIQNASTPGDITPLNCSATSDTIGNMSCPPRCQSTAVEPISTGNGNYYYQHTDLAIPGRGLAVTFQRTYNTLDTYAGPLGANWTHSYNTALTATAGGAIIKWGDGHTETFTSSGGNYAPPLGIFSALVKNGDGTFTLTQKTQTKYSFSTAGKLTSISDKNGNTILLTYDSSGNLTQITDAVGRNLTLAYDSSNRIIQITDPTSRTMTLQYDADNNLVQATDPAGGITMFAYDSNHRVTTITQPNGTTLLQNTYDSAGRVISQTGGRGFITTLTYGTPNAGDTTITDARGNQTIHTYDSSLRIVKIIDAAGGITAFAYDANNDRTSVTNQNGKTTSFTYDAQGNITGITDPLSNVVAFTYDTKNDLLTAINAKAKTTIFSYDTNGNLKTIQDALSNTTTFSYDGSGQLATKTDAKGNATTFSYDSLGNLTQIRDALSHSSTLSYDGIGRLTTITDPNGHTATATYDALSRLTKIRDPLGNQAQFAYDAVSNLLKITDANGHVTSYAYDATNNLVTVTDALGHFTQYAYDPNNNRTTFINAKGNAISYAYDALNQLNRIVDPLSFATAYAYDSVGNVLAVTDAKGQTNQFAYDALNRLLTISYSDGKNVAYGYDTNGNRTSMADSHGTTTYGYDSLDRLTSVTHVGGKVVTYAYDPVGNRRSLTYADGKTVSYAYDPANRLAGVTDWLGRSTNYAYDAASNLTAAAYPNQAALAFVYDAANRLTQVRNSYRGSADLPLNPITRFTYVLDPLGNRLQVTDGSGKSTFYGYDPLYQLASVRVGSGANVTRFTYDAVGNRLSLTAPGTAINYSYDADDRLLFAGTSSFTYDANGNQTSKTQTATGQPIVYSYDAANRLTGATGAVTSTFTYDGDGNRISQSVGTGTYSYLNDVATALPVVLQEAGPDGNISYAYGLGLVSESNSTFDAFYQYDGLGSVVGLTDPTGKLLGRYAYDAWGQTDLTAPGPQLGTKNKFRFTGEALDPGTQLYYLRARYYDPSAGRFITQDPLRGIVHNPRAFHRYVYVLNDPINFRDPSGYSRERATASALDSLGNFWDQSKFYVGLAAKVTLDYIQSGLGSLVDLLKAREQIKNTYDFAEAFRSDPNRYLVPQNPQLEINAIDSVYIKDAALTTRIDGATCDILCPQLQTWGQLDNKQKLALVQDPIFNGDLCGGFLSGCIPKFKAVRP